VATRDVSPHAPLRRFSSFVVVGAVGFVVDGGILSTLIHLYGWSHVSARAVSFAVAVTVTWYCNRRWVFSATSDRAREYGAYLGVQAVGALINLGTYLLLIALFPPLARLPLLPFAAGSALALLFNYSGASRWVFAERLKGS
jgi:putative flippase GtrA